MSLIEPNNQDKNKFKDPKAERQRIIKFLKFILNYITKISKVHYENTDKNIRDIIRESDLFPIKEIKEQELHIMEIASFDSTIDYYSFIISVFKYNINKLKDSSDIKIKNYLYKDLIDICTLINIIITSDEKSIEDSIIKFYAYHLINVFAECKEKMEISKIFFKMGQIVLMDKYQIKDFNKYFPIDIKIPKYKEFLKSICNLVTKCQNIYNDNIKDPKYIVDNFPIGIKKIKEQIKIGLVELEDNNQIPKASIIKSILYNLGYLLTNVIEIKQIVPYKRLIYSITNILDLMNEFDISYSLCFIDFNTDKKSLTLRKKENKDMQINDEDNYNKWALYLLKFLKYNELKSVLTHDGKLSSAQELKEILADKQFQNKIYRFFNSKSIMTFLKTKLEKRISNQIEKKYADFLNLLTNKNFWDSIMFFTLPKYIKGFVWSYMRIVINDNFIIFHKVENNEQKNELLRFFLFELIIHELMHFLRRYFLIGIETIKALTPPGSEESKKNLNAGEIGESFIKYVFGFRKITSITLKQAKLFSKLSFESEKDVEELRNIISLEPSFDKESSIYIKFQDSRKDLENETYIKMEGGCLYSFRNISNFK